MPFNRVAGEVVHGEGPLSSEVVNVRQLGDACFARHVRPNCAVRRALRVLGRLTT